MRIRSRVGNAAFIALATVFVGAGAAQAAPAVLNPPQLTDQFNTVFNRAVDRNTRINLLADPSAITGADNIAALKDVFGWAFGWTVVNPVVRGETMNAKLEITLKDGSNRNGQKQYYPMTWNNVGNQWKLSKATVCSLAKQFQTTC